MENVDYHAACLVPGLDYGVDPSDTHPTRVCVVDLGTNSFHTLIVNAYPNGSFEVLDRLKEMVRLGERGLKDHRLTEGAINRSVRALKRVRLLAEGWGVSEYLAFATSAIREAENGGELIERIRRETSIHVQVIDGIFEANLIYQGVRRALDMRRPTLLVDIGGGSTEFVVATSDEVFYATSLKLGAARMAGQFVSTDPIAPSEFSALRAHFRTQLEPVLEKCRVHGVTEIVGSSGTFESVTQVCANAGSDTDRSIFLRDFEADELRVVTRRLMESKRRERFAMDGIEKKRVDQIVPGAMLIDVLLKDLAPERVRVSSHALREGMVVYFIRQNLERLEVISPHRDIRRRSVHEIGHRFRWNQRHVQHVTAMALQLFDVCRPMHGLDLSERELLEYASLLHDIGYYISRESHHKHSLYLIRQADWHGFQPEEIDVMANVARYHRRSMPKDKHTYFIRLPEDNQRLVRQLASFLRLANGLDRSHYQNVRRLQAELDHRFLNLVIETVGDPQLEVWGGRRASDLFEETFGRKVRLQAIPMETPVIDSAAGVKAGHLLT